jgi:hypothetical protein
MVLLKPQGPMPSAANSRMALLRGFTRAELLQELVRRENEGSKESCVPWCHDCRLFSPWDSSKAHLEMPQDYNPCSKGHVMNFVAPDDFGADCGFYRNVCLDRVDTGSES